MREAKGVFEIPREAIVNLFKLGLGAGLLVAPFVVFWGHGELWPLAVPLVVVGLPLVVANTHLLIARPPVLRASRAGLWFGGGAIIPWSDVASILDAGLSPPPQAGTAWKPAHHQISIGFTHRGVVLCLPWWLWFTAWLPGRIAISLYLAEYPVASVLGVLESLRMASLRAASLCVGRRCMEVGPDEPTRARGAGDLRAARLLRKS